MWGCWGQARIEVDRQTPEFGDEGDPHNENPISTVGAWAGPPCAPPFCGCSRMGTRHTGLPRTALLWAKWEEELLTAPLLL